MIAGEQSEEEREMIAPLHRSSSEFHSLREALIIAGIQILSQCEGETLAQAEVARNGTTKLPAG